MQLTGADGVEIAVSDTGGTGPALVLLHGAARNLADWSAMLPMLAADFRVVAMDLRGHGRSGDAPWSLTSAADDVVAVIGELELDAVVAVGHSLGGMVAAELASRPGVLVAAVNLDGHGAGDPSQYDGLPADAVRTRLAELRAAAPTMLPGPRLSEAEADDLLSAVETASAAAGVDADHAVAGIRRALAVDGGGYRFRPSPEVVAAVLDEVETLDLPATYRAARCPLLVVRATRAGGADWQVELHTARGRWLDREMAAVAADNPLVEYALVDADHGLTGVAPQLTADLVVSFVRKVYALR